MGGVENELWGEKIDRVKGEFEKVEGEIELVEVAF